MVKIPPQGHLFTVKILPRKTFRGWSHTGSPSVAGPCGQAGSERPHADESSSVRCGWPLSSAGVNIRLPLNVAAYSRVISDAKGEFRVAAALVATRQR